jgi:hypothetical protein
MLKKLFCEFLCFRDLVAKNYFFKSKQFDMLIIC